MRCGVMVALRKQLICAAMFSTPLSDGKSLPTRAKMISLTMLQQVTTSSHGRQTD
jgi:hypothetical protein